MLIRIRIISLCFIALVALSGCAGGAFGGIGSEKEAVDSPSVVRQLQYFDRGDSGELFEVSLTVPEEWVDNYETVSNGSVLTFNRIADGISSPVFSIHTLSYEQFWEQSGSYPGDYTLLASAGNTYFMYGAPAEAFYSRLSAEAYQELLGVVSETLTTFEFAPVDNRMM